MSAVFRTSNRAIAWRLLLLAGLACGCGRPRENIPAYHWTDDRAALRALGERAASVKTVGATALLTLTRPDGQSVRLDGAIAMAPPTREVRLRAWKFGQPVFDLTLTPAGLWIETPRDGARRAQVLPASISAARLAEALSLFGGGVFEGPDVRLTDTGGPRFRVRKPLDQGQTMEADVDRATLTVRQYRLIDPSGAVRFTLSLGGYRVIDKIAWPTRLDARSGDGRIEAELRDVELNAPLPPKAFVPPRGAEKRS